MKTKLLVQGAMIGSLSFLFSLFNNLTSGMFDVLLGYILVFPISYYMYQYGLKTSIILAISMIIGNFFFTNPYFFLIILYSIILGINIGFHLKNKLSLNLMFITTFIFSFIYNVLLIEVLAKLLMIPDLHDFSDFLPLFQLPYIGFIYQYLGLNVLFVSLTAVIETVVILLINQFFYFRFHILEIMFHQLDQLVNLKEAAISLIIGMISIYIPSIIGRYGMMISILIVSFYSYTRLAKYLYRTRFLLLWALVIPYLNVLLWLLGCLFIFNDIVGDIVYNRQRKEG